MLFNRLKVHNPNDHTRVEGGVALVVTSVPTSNMLTIMNNGTIQSGGYALRTHVTEPFGLLGVIAGGGAGSVAGKGITYTNGGRSATSQGGTLTTGGAGTGFQFPNPSFNPKGGNGGSSTHSIITNGHTVTITGNSPHPPIS